MTAAALAPKAVTPAAVNGANRFPIKVNDAKTLDGVAASDYVRGSGAAGVYSVTSASPKTVISVPPFGKPGIGCEKSQGFTRFADESGDKIVVAIELVGGVFQELYRLEWRGDQWADVHQTSAPDLEHPAR